MFATIWSALFRWSNQVTFCLFRRKSVGWIKFDCVRFLSVSIAISFLGCASSNSQETPPIRAIKLDSAYTTQPQKPCQNAVLDDLLPFQDNLPLFRRLLPVSSNIFFVKADDINEAIGEGIRFGGGSEVRLPAATDSSKIWLVVYLGSTSSSPTQFKFDAIEQHNAKIIVTFTRNKTFSRTADSVPYFLFTPISNLQGGAFDLELRETTTQSSTLSRKLILQK